MSVPGGPPSSAGEPDCERCVDAAAYVLRGLDEHEVQAFGEHLDGCAICRQEVAELQGAADALALGVTQTAAPEELRARIMSTVHAEAELRRPARHESERPARAPSRWRRQLVPALAAAAALGVGILIGALAINTGTSEHTQVIRALVVAPGHRATAELRKVGTQFELVVEGLPAPPAGRIYEVWLERGSEAPAPTDALFSVTKEGNGAVGVPGNLSGISKVLVTDEPLGGSPKPTRKPIIIAST